MKRAVFQSATALVALQLKDKWNTEGNVKKQQKH